MKRRRFLCGVLPATVVLAGCQIGYSGPANPSPESSPTTSLESSPSPTPTRTARPIPDGYWRTVSLEGQGTVADRHQATLTATVEQRWITADRTARLPITLTNNASQARMFYNFNEVEVKRGWFEDEGASLGWGSDPPECIGTDGKEPGPFGENGAVWGRELQPGESITMEFGVFDDASKQGCISPGTYQFNWEIGYTGSTQSDGTVQSAIQWGITLRIRGSE